MAVSGTNNSHGAGSVGPNPIISELNHGLTGNHTSPTHPSHSHNHHHSHSHTSLLTHHVLVASARNISRECCAIVVQTLVVILDEAPTLLLQVTHTHTHIHVSYLHTSYQYTLVTHPSNTLKQTPSTHSRNLPYQLTPPLTPSFPFLTPHPLSPPCHRPPPGHLLLSTTTVTGT